MALQAIGRIPGVAMENLGFKISCRRKSHMRGSSLMVLMLDALFKKGDPSRMRPVHYSKALREKGKMSVNL